MAGARAITLLHLYGDLLNLYGETGGVTVLAAALRADGHQVEIRRQSLGDDLAFEGVDMVLIGCGTEANQALAAGHLRVNADRLREYLARGGLLLATGNAADLFGECIVAVDGTEVPAGQMFNYWAHRLIDREVGEALFRFGPHNLIGFQNRGSRVEFPAGSVGVARPLFVVRKGFGTIYADEDAWDAVAGDAGAEPSLTEGFQIGGFIGTSVLGLVARNPAVIAWLAQSVLDGRYGDATKVTDNDMARFGLQLDQSAFKAFLARHHGVFD